MTATIPSSGCPIAHDFDPFGDRYREDPYRIFSELRDAAPVVYVPELDVYLVTRYDDIVKVFIDRETFSSEGASSNFSPLCPEAQHILSTGFPRKATLTNCDAPRHTRMRATVVKCLTPRRWSQSQPAVRAYATQLVDALIAKPVADLQADLAYSLPAFAGFALLGFPPEDTDLLKSWCTNRVLLTYGKLPSDKQIQAAQEVVDFWNYTAAHVQRRIKDPGDDLTSDLLEVARKSNDEVTTEDVLNMVYSISLASHETSQNAILNGLRRLLENRDQWNLLCENPTLIPDAVEELLRYDAPAISLRRKTTRDTEIGGIPIPAGARVMMLTGSANRDPQHFPDPETLNVRRPNAREHLSLGKQWHFCLGAPLARFEYSLVLEQLTQKAPRMRLLPGQTFDYHPLAQFRVMKQLLVEPMPRQ